MNKKIDFAKLFDFYEKNKKNLPAVIGFLVVVIFGTLIFVALFPFKNTELTSVHQARLEELDVKFNTKILNELETKQKPTEINGVGGRDPFARF